MPYRVQLADGLLLTRFEGAIPDTEGLAMVEELRQTVEGTEGPLVSLSDITHLGHAGSIGRRALSDQMRQYSHRVLRTAVCSTSIYGRLVARMVIRDADRAHFRVFADPETALQWLEEVKPGVRQTAHRLFEGK